MVYKCKHFAVEELMSKAMFDYCKQKNLNPWRFFSPTTLMTLDAMRDKYGPCSINTWKWGGPKQFSGAHFMGEYRGNPTLSGHPHCRAFDLNFSEMTAKQVREDIVGRELTMADHMMTLETSEYFPHISELEFGSKITWVHTGFNTNTSGILCYAPLGA